MNKADFKVNFWGTQGSAAASNMKKIRYGCNTPCVSVECGGHVFVFDMGTGIIPFSKYFLKKYSLPQSINLFISHYHLDHIEGLPFAGITYTPGVNLHFYGQAIDKKQPKTLLSDIFSPPYFPLSVIKESDPERLLFHTVEPCETLYFADGAIKLENLPVPHPGGSLSYKVSYQGKSFCYLSDFEYGGEISSDLIAYLDGCDLAAFDAYFTNDNLISGWGHSTWEQGVGIWRAANLKQMAMYHHHVDCTDDELDALAKQLGGISKDLFIARDGLELYI